MYFDLNDEQRQIKETAREFLAARYRSERIRELIESERGFEEADWKEMAGLGWPGLALALCGSDEQRERYLRPLAEGTSRGTVAALDAGAPSGLNRFTMEAKASGDGVVLEGEKTLVMDA